MLLLVVQALSFFLAMMCTLHLSVYVLCVISFSIDTQGRVSRPLAATYSGTYAAMFWALFFLFMRM